MKIFCKIFCALYLLVGFQFLEETRNQLLSREAFRLGKSTALVPDFGAQDVRIPWFSLKGFRHKGVRPVHVRHVEEPNAAVIGVA